MLPEKPIVYLGAWEIRFADDLPGIIERICLSVIPAERTQVLHASRPGPREGMKSQISGEVRLANNLTSCVETIRGAVRPSQCSEVCMLPASHRKGSVVGTPVTGLITEFVNAIPPT